MSNNIASIPFYSSDFQNVEFPKYLKFVKRLLRSLCVIDEPIDNKQDRVIISENDQFIREYHNLKEGEDFLDLILEFQNSAIHEIELNLELLSKKEKIQYESYLLEKVFEVFNEYRNPVIKYEKIHPTDDHGFRDDWELAKVFHYFGYTFMGIINIAQIHKKSIWDFRFIDADQEVKIKNETNNLSRNTYFSSLYLFQLLCENEIIKIDSELFYNNDFQKVLGYIIGQKSQKEISRRLKTIRNFQLNKITKSQFISRKKELKEILDLTHKLTHIEKFRNLKDNLLNLFERFE